MKKGNDRIAVIMLLEILLLSVGFFSSANADQPGQIVLNPVVDTYVDSSSQNSNHGGENYLDVSKTSYQTQIVWLKFNLSSVPDGAVFDVVTLQLFAAYANETYDVYACSCSDSSWSESTLTYSNMPSYNTTSMDSQVVPIGQQWYNWSIVDAVRSAMSSVQHPRSVTIALLETSTHSGGFVDFVSKENSIYGLPPKIIVHWSAIPEFPSILIVPLFMVATLLAVTVYRRIHSL